MTTELADEPVSTKKPKSDKPAPPAEPTPPNRKPLVVQVRGTDAYRAWVERLAKHEYEDIAGLVEQALRAYAKAKGFDEPQPER
jgi:hypothetical protein